MDWDCVSVPVDDCVLVAVKDGEDDPVAVTVIVPDCEAVAVTLPVSDKVGLSVWDADWVSLRVEDIVDDDVTLGVRVLELLIERVMVEVWLGVLLEDTEGKHAVLTALRRMEL